MAILFFLMQRYYIAGTCEIPIDSELYGVYFLRNSEGVIPVIFLNRRVKW